MERKGNRWLSYLETLRTAVSLQALQCQQCQLGCCHPLEDLLHHHHLPPPAPRCLYDARRACSPDEGSSALLAPLATNQEKHVTEEWEIHTHRWKGNEYNITKKKKKRKYPPTSKRERKPNQSRRVHWALLILGTSSILCVYLPFTFVSQRREEKDRNNSERDIWIFLVKRWWKHLHKQGFSKVRKYKITLSSSDITVTLYKMLTLWLSKNQVLHSENEILITY